jgi:glycosyltransferase involved in cell wall biosynthesis
MGTDKKVVFLRTNAINPDPRVEKEASALVKNGIEVIVIGWDRESKGNNISYLHSGIKIYRVGILAGFGSGIRNLVPLLVWQIKLLLALISLRKEYDVIHACDFNTVLPALLSKFILNKKVVYDIFDFYVDAFPVPKKLRGFIKWLDFKAIASSDAVIITSEKRAEQIAGSRPNDLIVIHNTPQDIFTNNNSQLSNTSNFIITYVGILEDHRFLLEMIDAVGHFPAWKFNIAGFGSLEPRIVERIKRYNNIVFHGKVDYSTGLALSNEADLLFAIYDPEIPNHKYSSPNKLYESMMLGKPIIVAKGTGIDLIVKENNMGYVVEYGQSHQLEAIFKEIANNPLNLVKMKKNARTAYTEQYSWDIMERRLVDLYNKI